MQKPDFPYNNAIKAAEYIFNLLHPHCNRIHIAGSIRRMRHMVKDIEIVCEPKREFVQKGLFAENGDWLIIPEFTEALAGIQQAIIKGDINGRYMQIKTTSKLCPDIYLDLFMPQPEDYYRQLAIRTGSAEYAHHVLAAAWRRMGWTGVQDVGLRKIAECLVREVNGKKLYEVNPAIEMTKPPVWQSELELFQWLKINYTDPEYREYHSPVKINA